MFCIVHLACHCRHCHNANSCFTRKLALPTTWHLLRTTPVPKHHRHLNNHTIGCFLMWACTCQRFSERVFAPQKAHSACRILGPYPGAVLNLIFHLLHVSAKCPLLLVTTSPTLAAVLRLGMLATMINISCLTAQALCKAGLVLQRLHSPAFGSYACKPSFTLQHCLPGTGHVQASLCLIELHATV